MHDPMYPFPKAMWQACWQLLDAATKQDSHPFKLAGLSTTASNGRPSARTVVLRAADAKTASLDFYTDLRSEKVDELAAQPFAHWLFWDAETQLQFSAVGAVKRASRARELAIFQSLPKHSRKAYATLTPPGTPLPSTSDEIPENWPSLSQAETEDLAKNFGVFTTYLLSADLLHLNRNGHQRMVAKRKNQAQDWQLNWVTP